MHIEPLNCDKITIKNAETRPLGAQLHNPYVWRAASRVTEQERRRGRAILSLAASVGQQQTRTC